jgi:lipid-A-disaccharide synthase
MITYYKVSPLSWLAGRLLVRVPFYSMVNLVAGRAVVPELMQGEMTGERLASEALRLLRDAGARERMRQDLAEVAGRLSQKEHAMTKAAALAEELMEGHAAHVS